MYLVAAALPTARGAADICRGEGAHIKHIFDYYLLITNSVFDIEKLWQL